ncbi:hypothetical protein [Kitasatospora sp. NPDC057015]|uniref:hypothetical protein n=1 Tax=Kitasatospora sp. NPDC057015 TaxID=3346001 RepID=UPI00363B2558
MRALLPKPAPTPLPPEGPPARHRRPRLEDPVPEGTVSRHEARGRKHHRECHALSGDGGTG